MALLSIKVEEFFGQKSAITITFTNDIEKQSIIDVMKDIFEIEMISAEITTNKINTSVSIKTDNKEKVEAVRKGMIKTFRQRSGLNQINSN